MMMFMGARNTRGFSEKVSSGKLPELTHLTYEGIFNEIKFDIGKKSDKIVDLHHGYARAQFTNSMVDGEINDYLAIFLKSSKDGADRDQRPLNAMICLDISGSMAGKLNHNQKQSTSRLKLSIEAIKMLISKLRQNDSIGLVTFDTSGYTIFEPTFKKNLDSDVYNMLDEIVCKGGTTIRSGFQLSKKLLKEFINKHELNNCQNRIMMLTDVGDNSFEGQQKLIQTASVEDGINLTVIGISSQFRSQVCQKLNNVKGFNYFCAINQQDLKKYVFQTFDFGFFVSAYDLNISISSEDIKKIEVFGAPDSDKVASYNNNFKGDSTTFAITKMKSAFPSQLEIHEDKVFTIGGLILVKLKRKSQDPFFKGELSLSYSDAQGQFYEQKYNIAQEFHQTEQFYSEESLRAAIQGYHFTSELRFLINVSKDMKEPQIYKNYWESLNELGLIVPQSKKKDYENVKKIVQGFNK